MSVNIDPLPVLRGPETGFSSYYGDMIRFLKVYCERKSQAIKADLIGKNLLALFKQQV